MFVSITTLQGDVYQVGASPEMELADFRAIVCLELQPPPSNPEHLILVHNGVPLLDMHKKLVEYGIQDNDLLFAQVMQPSPSGPRTMPAPSGGLRSTHSAAGGGPQVSNPGRAIGFPELSQAEIEAIVSSFNPGNTNRHARGQAQSQAQSQPGAGPTQPVNPEMFRQQLLSQPGELALLRERNPALAEAINNVNEFARVFEEQMSEMRARHREREELQRRAWADPFDPEIQRRIDEEIQQKNIDESMEHAMEYMPEAFGQVIMLYALSCTCSPS